MNLKFTNPILPIGEIKIPEEFSMPRLEKLKKCMDFYRKNKRFDRQIIVDSEKTLHDGYCAYLVAVLMGAEKVKVLMVGEKPDIWNPITEPVKESKPEPVKLYCVKSWMPGSWITEGKIYEIRSDGCIRFDDGYSPAWESLAKPSMQTNSLFPLVRRPAKVGEWVYVKHAYDWQERNFGIKPGKIYKVHKVLQSRNESRNECDVRLEVNGEKSSVCVNTEENYLVLDGYKGDAE